MEFKGQVSLFSDILNYELVNLKSQMFANSFSVIV